MNLLSGYLLFSGTGGATQIQFVEAVDIQLSEDITEMIISEDQIEAIVEETDELEFVVEEIEDEEIDDTTEGGVLKDCDD